MLPSGLITRQSPVVCCPRFRCLQRKDTDIDPPKSILHDACQKCQCHFPNLPCDTPEKESPTLKKNIAFRLCFATSVFVATTVLSAQQAPPSAASGLNMTEEQVNDANIQLMRQD